MADNDTLPATGAIVATDDIAGVKYQRVKITHGVDGVATDASATDPLPVSIGAGRVSKIYRVEALAGVTVQALITTMVMMTDLVSAAASTTYTVTAGKTFRVQSLAVVWRNNTAAAGGVTIRLRAVATGTTVVGSPVIASLNATTAVATIGSGATATIGFPDGLELPAGANFGISQIAVGAVVGFDVQLVGYEY